MIKVLNYTKNPLSLMGECASDCWDSTPSPQIGIHCIESGHGRVLEYPDIIVVIDGYSARVIREIYTHIIGVTRLQSSTRYIQYGNFDYLIPEKIKSNQKALDTYKYFMQFTSMVYKDLEKYGIPKEDIANILPLGMISKIVLKINARAILHMAENRTCNRAYWEFRKFMKELLGVVSELDDEWKTIIGYAKTKCEVTGYCLEKNSCGRMPKKIQI